MQPGVVYRYRTRPGKLWLNWRRLATALSSAFYDQHLVLTDETCSPVLLCKEASSGSWSACSSQLSAADTERGGASPSQPPPAALQSAHAADPAPPPAGSPHSARSPASSPQLPAGSPKRAEHPAARGRSPPAEAGVCVRLCGSADSAEAGNSIALVANVEGSGRCKQLVLRRGDKIAASLLLEELNIIVADKHMVELSVPGAELAVFLAFENGAVFDQFHQLVAR
jgi:hypothetical protein